MKHLCGLDAAFLYLDSASLPMHIGSLASQLVDQEVAAV